jgi:hypothetical protein
MIKGATSFTYGGTLQLINLGSAGAGASFQLFSAAIYSGAFTNIIPAIPAINLAWNTNGLVTGLLSVVTAPTPSPRITEFKANAGTLTFTATNGVPGWPCMILSSTNLILPLNQWTVLATNSFDPGGNLDFTNAIAMNVPQTFYALRLQ